MIYIENQIITFFPLTVKEIHIFLKLEKKFLVIEKDSLGKLINRAIIRIRNVSNKNLYLASIKSEVNDKI